VPLSDYPERFKTLRTVYVKGQPYEVERVWYHKEQPIFKFRGVDSISAAEALKDSDVCIPASERLKLPEGEYFFSDLMGCSMVDDASGNSVGKVTGCQEVGPGIPVLLEVEVEGGSEAVLVPFAGALLKKIDVEGREIRVTLPEGLAELNG
jgi:16S rRNA processing protein RimM